jgi:hypothetical protein
MPPYRLGMKKSPLIKGLSSREVHPTLGSN